ncbi:hypothetical protein L3Y34_009040 [Caenorhabditis briggsae]|uniref:Uncharacterized protein n=1 Tax=Caenorhabditis briggsae TaxID=6238 RepID=A0AAE9D1G3_CAEBR|nr:hypothetical protein L3Y34_009040 [Caenorhabditis briggsae]
MTTNAMLRMRSKSISDVFATSEWDEDKEDLIPRQKQDNTLKSTLDKWKRSLNLNPRTNDQQPFDRRTSRANSFFSRPPLTHPRSRRQSLAVTIRRPSVIKDDLKKMWENRRASLSSLKTQIKDRITGKSNENLATSRDGNTFQRQQRSRYEEEED